MNSVYERRRANLTHLLREAGAKQQLAIRLDMTAPQISHWLREPGKAGARKITEDSARQIEKQLGLAPGELDLDTGAKLPSPSRDAPDLGMLADVTRAVLHEVGRIKGAPMAEKVAGIVALVYGHTLEHGKIDSAYVNQLVKLMH